MRWLGRLVTMIGLLIVEVFLTMLAYTMLNLYALLCIAVV